ncbi:protein kinase [Actinoplanes sp. NPDC051411]|uniref:serine/threonine protein kinase n=1 Tax=Actinoplanes sp. NPDC051411 TaxID=3155522 RepID=UPI00343A970B
MEVQETLGGRYKLLHELGTGGMAVVWRARDEVLGRPVAVKVLAGRFAGDPQSRARIRDEARAAATLSHPNIAQVYDYGESTDGGTPRPYVVMELVNGPTLQQRVASAPLPPRTVFRICGEVAAALAAAHADGLVHRDIKMANIMVTATGAKVVDFGIAAAVGPASPEEMLVGTPAYLAPERLTGAAVQAASDVYALGVLLYRLLAHEPPWTVETTTQMLNAHIYIEPSPLPRLPGVPPEVAGLIDRCLRKNPAERPTATEVSATLGDAAEAALLPVRGEPTRPATVPSPRAVEGEEYDELTSASHPRSSPVRAGGRRRSVPGRAATGATASGGAAVGAAGSGLPGGVGGSGLGGAPGSGLPGGVGDAALGGASGSGLPGGAGDLGVDGGAASPSPAPTTASGSASRGAASGSAFGGADPAASGSGTGASSVAGRRAAAGANSGPDFGPTGGADSDRNKGRSGAEATKGGHASGGGFGPGAVGSSALDPDGASAAFGAADGRGSADLTTGPGAEAVAFVPGAEIGAMRSPLPGEVWETSEDSTQPGTGSAGPGPAGPGSAGPGSGGAGRDSVGRGLDPEGRPAAEAGRGRGASAGGRRRVVEGDDVVFGAGVVAARGGAGDGGAWAAAGRAGSWVDSGLAGAVGEGDAVRKRRRNVLLAGGGVAALLAVVLGFWGLADRPGADERAASGVVGVAPSAVPSGAVRPSPSVSGAGSVLPDGSAGAGHPMLSVTASSVSAGPSDGPSSSGAGSASRPSGEPSAHASSGPVGTRLSSDGGVVYAVCSQGKGQLTSWEPNPGYTVQKVNQGPALAAEIVFKGATNRYRMTVTCVAGTPAPLVLPL